MRVVASGNRRKEQRVGREGEERQARCVVENRRGCGERASTTPKSVETGRLEEEGGKVEPWKKQG